MAGKAPNVVIIAGEASGDLQGACLANELRQLHPGIVIRGIGGRHMREADVDILYDSSSWGAIGIAEALKLVPSLLRILGKLRRLLEANPPDVLVLIDFGAFNVRLANALRSSGIKVLYYFPPRSWSRGATYSRLDGLVDRVVTPFPWSADILKGRGFQADFFGHPLLDIVKPSLSREAFCEQFGFDGERPIIGLLPGSRTHEIRYNMPVLLLAAARLAESIPGLQFGVPLASTLDAASIEAELSSIPWVEVRSYCRRNAVGVQRFALRRQTDTLSRQEGITPTSKAGISLIPGMAYDVLAHSRAAVVVSGTATVEAAILNCPMVIIYRGSRLVTLEFKLRRKNIKFVGMPNIILDRPACPEFIAEDASPVGVSDSMKVLIEDSPERARMLEDLAEIRSSLGEPGAVRKTAEAVMELLKSRKDSNVQSKAKKE